jgi:hypothetical protein
MQGPTSKSTAIFERPFSVPGFDELLPAGEYDLETEIGAPPDHLDPEMWKAAVRVQLHARGSHPGLSRSLTVPLAALEGALARDKHSGLDVVEFFVEEMLADPMIQLMMTADGISDTEIRTLYARNASGRRGRAASDQPEQTPALEQLATGAAVDAAENEGMPTCGP